jgi:hypothetical protein
LFYKNWYRTLQISTRSKKIFIIVSIKTWQYVWGYKIFTKQILARGAIMAAI